MPLHIVSDHIQEGVCRANAGALFRCICPASVRIAHMESAAQAKVNAGRVRIAADSALVITGEGVRLKALDLDGALVIAASPGAPI